MILNVSDLSLTLKGNRGYVKILDGINFSLEKGETLGIVGESGCGKSMTALSIMRLLPEKAKLSGDISFEGLSINKFSKRKMEAIRGHNVSMIFQDPLTSLNPLHTVGKQIEESLILHMKLTKKERMQRVVELLKEVGLPRAEELINEYPHQLSGGMRQRVMIAIAMACRPKLLICDEPTTALDVTVQAQILELMNGLKKENDMSIIMITHDLGVVAEVCDRIVVMYAGKVVESAPVKELFKHPKHPYTKGLMMAIPKMGTRKQPLGSIPGTVPSPEEMPAGCRFAERCPFAMEVCHTKEPPLTTFTNDHSTSCWLFDEKEVVSQ